MFTFPEIRIGFLYAASLKKRKWIFYFSVYSDILESWFFELQGLIIPPAILVPRQRFMHKLIKIFVKYSNSGRIRLLILICVSFDWVLLRKIFTTLIPTKKIVNLWMVLLHKIIIMSIL
jgi:hypothetical protein